ncbi:hypothetical protein E5358_07710 [Palleniella muris]|uniref:Uncharacterized protein n=1 Tax=Palleniella muris TaxID=3038145 RepID=A0AC61QQ11_9BACT|nr:hypothetical protein [Palleniella muris]TGX82184.1 hypothetical protein E5358_07710 [Palleniella muris]
MADSRCVFSNHVTAIDEQACHSACGKEHSGCDGSRKVSGMLYGASVLLFGGIGLLVAFVVELKLGDKK